MAVISEAYTGTAPVWKFDCPLCGRQWAESYVSQDTLEVLRTLSEHGKPTFMAKARCKCCNLLVDSEKIVVENPQVRNAGRWHNE